MKLNMNVIGSTRCLKPPVGVATTMFTSSSRGRRYDSECYCCNIILVVLISSTSAMHRPLRAI